jgi:hypothetical protein
MQIVYTDNRLITDDRDSGKGQTSPLDRKREPHIKKHATV